MDGRTGDVLAGFLLFFVLSGWYDTHPIIDFVTFLYFTLLYSSVHSVRTCIYTLFEDFNRFLDYHHILVYLRPSVFPLITRLDIQGQRASSSLVHWSNHVHRTITRRVRWVPLIRDFLIRDAVVLNLTVETAPSRGGVREGMWWVGWCLINRDWSVWWANHRIAGSVGEWDGYDFWIFGIRINKW